jgi:membrane-bound lytic murein transglycosylase B
MAANRKRDVKKRLVGALLFAAALQVMACSAEAAPCGNNSAGFEAWKKNFAEQARANGIQACANLGKGRNVNNSNLGLRAPLAPPRKSPFGLSNLNAHHGMSPDRCQWFRLFMFRPFTDLQREVDETPT